MCEGPSYGNLATLHYPYEIRSQESVFEEIPEMKLPDQMVGLAETIIDKMSGEFEPEKFEDRYGKGND
jgi:DNA end-binding protein Ku